MKFLLRLKHWQLFLITFGLPYLFSFISFPKFGIIYYIGSLLMFSGLFGWIWSIANVFYYKIIDREKFKLLRFRTMLFMSLSILILVFWSSEKNSLLKSLYPYILFSVPFYLAMMMYIILFAAKTLRTAELGRLAEFKEYLAEGVLIWIFPIGIWILQPRINKIMETI